MIVTADIGLSVTDGNATYSFFSRQTGVRPEVLTNFDRTVNSTFTLSDPAVETSLGLADMQHVRGLYIEVNNPTVVKVGTATFTLMPSQQGGLAKLFLETDTAVVSVSATDPTLVVQGIVGYVMRLQVVASAEQLVRSRSMMLDAVEELVDLAQQVCCKSDELAKSDDGTMKEIPPKIVSQMQKTWEVAYKSQMRKLGEDIKVFLERVSHEDLQSRNGEGH